MSSATDRTKLAVSLKLFMAGGYYLLEKILEVYPSGTLAVNTYRLIEGRLRYGQISRRWDETAIGMSPPG
jgi:hypothetical protein